MTSGKKSAAQVLKSFGLLLCIGLLLDGLLTGIFFLSDLLEVLNLSQGSLYHPGAALLKSFTRLYAGVFLPLGLCFTILLFALHQLQRTQGTIGKLLWIKADLLALMGIFLLFPVFYYFHAAWLPVVTLKIYRPITYLICGVFLLVSLISLYTGRKIIRIPLMVFRVMVCLMILPVFLALLIKNLSLAPDLETTEPLRAEAMGPAGPRNMNVLLITIDACRTDKLSLYRFFKPTSPHIEAFAGRSFVFDRAFSVANWTRPATASLFTSVYPGTHQTNALAMRVPEALLCLPERFKNAGYCTAVFSANGNVSPDFGFDQGVDYFYETVKKSMVNYAVLYRSLTRHFPWILNKRALQKTEHIISGDITEEEAVFDAFKKWLLRTKDDRFFAYIHFNTPHSHYIPPPAFDVFAEDPDVKVEGKEPRRGTRLSMKKLRRLIALYCGEIHYADFMVGKVLKTLERLALTDKTIVVITSDHGEEFYDHRGWGHGRTMYNELLHIPLIFHIPNFPYPAARISSLVSNIDIGPTLLSLAGLPGDDFMDGKDLTPLLEGSRQDVHDVVLAQDFRPRSKRSKTALISREFKFIQLAYESKKTEGLFDLERDFREKQRLLPLTSARYDRCRQELEHWNRYTLSKKVHSKTVQISPERMTQLQALGYID
jgi:arylsulfatase A-like enzyme